MQDEVGGFGTGRLQVAGVRVTVAALFAPAAPVVRLNVFAQVVAAHEALVAHRTGEALLARVSPQMPLQLVRAREALAAEEPVAHEGPLARVPAQVRLQVRRLPVHLAAARNVAAVQALAPQARPGRAQPLRLLAVGAVAGGAARVAAGRACRAPPGGGSRGARYHGAGGGGCHGGAGVRIGGQHRLEAVLGQQVLAGGEQVGGGGGGGAEARGAEGGVRERAEVGVVGAQLRVQRGLGGARVQRALEPPSGVLHFQPRARAAVHVPPRRRRAVGHLAGRQRRMEARLVPGLVRVRHAHARVQPVGCRRVHLGNEGRLATRLLRGHPGRCRRGSRRVGEEAAVVAAEGGRRGRRGGQAEGAVGGARAARQAARATAPGGHREAREAGAEVAAGRGALPGVKAAFGEGARLWQRRQRARVADLVAGRRQHGQRGRSEARLFLEWVGWGREQEGGGQEEVGEETKCTREQPRPLRLLPGGPGSPPRASSPRARGGVAAPGAEQGRSPGRRSRRRKVALR
nr:RecName: Full=Uncharacterized protein FLJ46347 [Homo sapiens]